MRNQYNWKGNRWGIPSTCIITEVDNESLRKAEYDAQTSLRKT